MSAILKQERVALSPSPPKLEVSRAFYHFVKRDPHGSGSGGMPLLDKITCPHCWAVFDTHSVLWISAHPLLNWDPWLKQDAGKRFIPTRFTAEGFALDEMNSPCHKIACRNCHLEIPRVCAEMNSCIVSIIGAPASGKSYFLGALARTLRSTLPTRFGISFTDSDLVMNKMINDYELSMFQNPKSNDYIPLGQIIAKTQDKGDGYSKVNKGSGEVLYPIPYMFTVRPKQNHPNISNAETASRVLCLYDNAGESYLAGSDTYLNPVTRHLSQASLLLFLFDPTQDHDFRKTYVNNNGSLGIDERIKIRQQQSILTEAANRVRALTNIPVNQKHQKPLFVLVTKKDLWGHLVPIMAKAPPLFLSGSNGISHINTDRIQVISEGIKSLLIKHSPAVVDAAESFAKSVTYVGVSSLGVIPKKDSTGTWVIRPVDINPDGVEVPILYGLNSLLPGMIPLGPKVSSAI